MLACHMKSANNSQDTITTLQPTREAARLLGVSVSFINEHRHELPGRHKAGRVFRWDVSKLRAWMRKSALGA